MTMRFKRMKSVLARPLMSHKIFPVIALALALCISTYACYPQSCQSPPEVACEQSTCIVPTLNVAGPRYVEYLWTCASAPEPETVRLEWRGSAGQQTVATALRIDSETNVCRAVFGYLRLNTAEAVVVHVPAGSQGGPTPVLRVRPDTAACFRRLIPQYVISLLSGVVLLWIVAHFRPHSRLRGASSSAKD